MFMKMKMEKYAAIILMISCFTLEQVVSKAFDSDVSNLTYLFPI